MVMDTLQIRLSHGLVERVDSLIDTGLYANRSDAIRDAVRRLVLMQIAGILPNKTDSIKEIKNLRKNLSKRKIDLYKINSLAD